jgi:hypothetical protein
MATNTIILYCIMNVEIKKQLRDQGQDVDDRDIFKHYILPHFEGALEDLQGT